MSKRKKKREMSKRLVAFALILYTVIALYSLTLMAITRDLTTLPVLIEVSGGFVSIAFGFYFWKAKLENKIKLMSLYKVDPDTESFKEE